MRFLILTILSRHFYYGIRKNPLSCLSGLGVFRLLIFIFVWQDQVQDDSCHG